MVADVDDLSEWPFISETATISYSRKAEYSPESVYMSQTKKAKRRDTNRICQSLPALFLNLLTRFQNIRENYL